MGHAWGPQLGWEYHDHCLGSVARERLRRPPGLRQALFTKSVFVETLKAYEQDGIDAAEITYKDNKDLLELFDAPQVRHAPLTRVPAHAHARSHVRSLTRALAYALYHMCPSIRALNVP